MTRKLPAIGDIIETNIGELYVFLGYYEGETLSLYPRPDEGYVYVFIGNSRHRSLLNADYQQAVQSRIRHNIDGNGCYVKTPKPYVQLAGHVDLTTSKIQYAFGLNRLGDKRPVRKAQA